MKKIANCEVNKKVRMKWKKTEKLLDNSAEHK